MSECNVCGREINTKTDAYYQWIEGWAKARSAGGPNAISAPTRRPLFRCGTCDPDQIDGQTRMFE